MVGAIVVAAAIAAGSGDGAVLTSVAAAGVVARTKAVVDYAARAVAKNRNFTGDLRRAWQHMAQAGELRRTRAFAAAARHALRARELGRRAIVANGWKLKRAFMRETSFEKTIMTGVGIGELDRAVDEIAVREELSEQPTRSIH